MVHPLSKVSSTAIQERLDNLPVAPLPALESLIFDPCADTNLAFGDFDLLVFAFLILATRPIVWGSLCTNPTKIINVSDQEYSKFIFFMNSMQ